jgi:hypothetical protein
MVPVSVVQTWSNAIPSSLLDSFEVKSPPVVFIGSGLGQEAVPALDTAAKLCEQLRAKLGVSDHGEGLAELLQYLKNREAGSRRAVSSWLKQALLFDVAKPGGAHHLLAELSIREMLTTNYDLLIEEAAIQAGKNVANVYSADNYRDAIPSLSSKKLLLGRLHGAFHGEDKMVATTDDYIDAFNTHNWSEIFTEKVQSGKLLFIGYSLRDFNIWTTYITALMRSHKNTWPHVMVAPYSTVHPKDFWSRYNVQLVQLKAHEFLIGLHHALGSLDKNKRIAYAAVAACRGISLEAAEVEINAVATEYRFNNPIHAALMCIEGTL